MADRFMKKTMIGLKSYSEYKKAKAYAIQEAFRERTSSLIAERVLKLTRVA
jgi:hypothetical protein